MFSNKKTRENETSLEQFIFAYGFDKAGFHCSSKPVGILGSAKVVYVEFDSSLKLDDADGVIIPSGIFEKITAKEWMFDSWYEVECCRDLMLEREKQVWNLIQGGKWVCFLVDEIIDRPKGKQSADATDTDLCKRILNRLEVKRLQETHGLQVLGSKCPEFADYIRDYGVAKTAFYPQPSSAQPAAEIALCGDQIVAFEVDRKFFFLPFHTTNTDPDSTAELVRVVAEAVSKYRQNRSEDIPEWADAFEFAGETTLKRESEKLKSRLAEVGNSIDGYRINKSILVSSGDALRDSLVSILRDFFGLTIDSLDEHREDSKVIDDKGQTLVLLEFKAMNSGVRQEDVSQINFHRDRAGLAETLPGVLVANSSRKVTSIQDRLGAEIDGKQIQYARNQNVLIVRTIDLLFLMRKVEDKPVAERREMLMAAFSAGGGWLKASESSYEIVTA